MNADNASMWFSSDPDVIGGHHPHADERKILLKRYLCPSLFHRSFPFLLLLNRSHSSHQSFHSRVSQCGNEWRKRGRESLTQSLRRDRSLREGKETPWVPIPSHDFNTCFLPKSIEFRKRENWEGRKRRERGSYHNNELMRTLEAVIFIKSSIISDKYCSDWKRSWKIDQLVEDQQEGNI